MVTISEAEKTICQGVLKNIASFGFVKVGRAMLQKDRTDGISWQIRFGGRRDATSMRILISVFAGIRFEDVESVRERDLDDDRAPSISVPIHFLHKDQRLTEWDWEDRKSITLIAKDVKDHAIPFFERYENLAVLLEALKSPNPMDWLSISRTERPELMASIMVVLGMKDEARRVLQQAIEERQTKPIGHRLPFERMLKRLFG